MNDEAEKPLRIRMWRAHERFVTIEHTRDLRPLRPEEARVQRAVHAYSLALAGLDGWRDMTSVPKDGTRFWGKVDNDAIAMFWMDEFDGFVSSYRQMVMAPGYTVDGKATTNHSPVYHTPAAWMPIPDAGRSAQG